MAMSQCQQHACVVCLLLRLQAHYLCFKDKHSRLNTVHQLAAN